MEFSIKKISDETDNFSAVLVEDLNNPECYGIGAFTTDENMEKGLKFFKDLISEIERQNIVVWHLDNHIDEIKKKFRLKISVLKPVQKTIKVGVFPTWDDVVGTNELCCKIINSACWKIDKKNSPAKLSHNKNKFR